MGLIQDYLRKLREKKEDKNSYAEEQNVREDFERKKINSNERELMRFREEERQKRIKNTLARYKKKENDKIWRGREANPAYAGNVVAGHKKLFNGKNNIKEADDFFKGQKDLFKVKKGGKKK